jgi:sugar/nucleoside kinase (ribokinase family)
MADVACLGILVADLLGRPIDALPPRGRLSLVDEMTLNIGGCAANTGIAMQRLGLRVAALGMVGSDGLGEFIVNTLKRSGLDIAGVECQSNASTSASMVIVGSDGERSFLHHLGGNAQFRAEHVNWDVIRSARLLHIGGALVMPAFDGEPMAEVLAEAKRMGLRTSLDTVWDATGAWMETLAPCLPHTDLFLPSLSEAQELTGLREPGEVARALRDRGVGTVALKMGPAGSYVLDATGEATVPSFKVQPVDGTGSGDAYVAGFLCGVLRGWETVRCTRFANAVGAMCVTALGATGGIRSLEETETFIATASVA